MKATWNEAAHAPASTRESASASARASALAWAPAHAAGPAAAPQRVGSFAWLRQGMRLLCSDLRRHRVLSAVVAAIWVLALVRVFVHHVPLVPILFNWSPSVPYRVAVVDYRAAPVSRGDLVVYAFDGPAAANDYPGLRRQAFFKRVAGVAGDVVAVHDREVVVGGVSVGAARTHTHDRRPLSPIEPGVIPPGKVYVMGTGAHSFDSRYREAGLVDVASIAAVVRPVF